MLSAFVGNIYRRGTENAEFTQRDFVSFEELFGKRIFYCGGAESAEFTQRDFASPEVSFVQKITGLNASF